MGKNNRQRRAAKQRQRARRVDGSGPGAGAGARPSGGRDPRLHDPFGFRCNDPLDDDVDDPRDGDAGAGDLFGTDPRVRALRDSGDVQALHELIVSTTCGVFWNQVSARWPQIRASTLKGDVPRYHDELRAPERRAVQRQIATWCADELAGAWDRNWTPDDLVQLCRRELDAEHGRWLTHLLLARVALAPNQSSMPARWRSQLETLADEVECDLDEQMSEPERTGWFERCGERSGLAGAQLWTTALMVVRMCMRAFAVQEVCPPPKQWIAGLTADRSDIDGAIDSKLLHRVRALLAKAESTTFEHEADSLTAKAQELMARHAIDQAVLDRHRTTRRVLPQSRRVWLDNPYADNKSVLLSRVARANRCEAVYSPDVGFSTVMGFAADLEVVDLLFTSLLVQGTAAVQAAGSVKDRHGVSRTRSFRSTFWLSYAIRIGERLEQTNQDVVDEAVAEHGTSLLPVLAAREEEVQEAFAAAFPHLTNRTVRFSNEAGYHAGRLAADQADLAVGKRLKPTG